MTYSNLVDTMDYVNAQNKLKSKRWERFPGQFWTVEGPDGSGKTTIVPHLVECVRAAGIEPVVVRQPGGSPFAEKIRQLVLGTEDTGEPVQYISEALLFAAARAQCLEAVVKPALRDGKLVIADRWYDSNFAYQGTGRGMIGELEVLETLVEGNFKPDITVFLKIPLHVAQARLAGRVKEFNRMNAEEMMFKQRTYEGYEHRRMIAPHRMMDLNADQTPERVKEDLEAMVQARLLPFFNAHRAMYHAQKAIYPKLVSA
jgi:dTMP kinase